jgi:predicted RNase H-like HicB family nuclease
MKKPDRYVYPAVLTYEDGYEIAVTFPGLRGCATSGETDTEALMMAKEALGLHLWGMENDGDELPAPSPIRDIELEAGEIVALVEVYMPSVRLSQENRSVNRTVTLPAWLNAQAMERGVNFSQVLQDALRAEINRPRA